MISCDEATMISDKKQYHEASFWERIKLRIHLFICEKCSLYNHQNFAMTAICKSHLVGHNHHVHLTDKEKENLKKEFNKSF